MKKILIYLTVFSFFCFVFAGKIQAKTLIQEKGTVNISKEETINDDLFVGAESVTIEGTINGDVFIGARTIKQEGVINGNLHLGGGAITVSGEIQGNLYAGGGSVVLRGAKITGSVICGSGSLVIDDQSSIGGSLISGSGSVDNQALVGRNVFIGSNSIILNSEIGGEVKLGGGKIEIGSKAVVVKDLTYLTDEKGTFTLSPLASISGEIIKTDKKLFTSEKAKQEITKGFSSAKMAWQIFSFLGALMVGFLIIKLFPKSVLGVSNQIQKSFFSNLGIGLLFLILVFPALILLAITGVGLPLAGISFSLLMINLYLTKLAVGVGLGEFISGKFNWKKLSLAGQFSLGLLIIFLLLRLPVIGGLVSLLVTLVGLGAILIYSRNALKKK